MPITVYHSLVQGWLTFHTKGHIEKYFEAEAALIGKAKEKSSTRSEMSYFPLKLSEEQKKVFGLIHSR